MDIKIGFLDSTRELDLELPDDTSQEKLVASIDASIAAADKLLWVSDKKGRQIGLMANHVAYVIVGAQKEERRVGFGA